MAARQSRHACHVSAILVAFDDNAIITSDVDILWHLFVRGQPPRAPLEDVPQLVLAESSGAQAGVVR